MIRARFFLTMPVIILGIFLAGCTGPRSGGSVSGGENLAGLSGKLRAEALALGFTAFGTEFLF